MASTQETKHMNAMAAARQLLAEALAIAEHELPGDSRIGTIEQWDSLAHARIILALEEQVGQELSAEEAVAIASLADIARIIERHG
jgi:acyl carrier protein